MAQMYRLVILSALITLFVDQPAKERITGNRSPTAHEIIERAVARADTQYESLVDAKFESEVISTIKSLDIDGDITKTVRTKRRQYPLQGALFDELVEKDGRPLNEKELRDEEKRKRDFIREVAERTS